MSVVRCEFEGDVAVLTLCNEEKLNALTMGMLHQLETFLTEIERNAQVRSVVLTGEGSKAFCCGADIAEWGPLGPAEFARHWVREGHRVFDRIARFSKPSVGALNGHAFGGGLELAACCDVRVLSNKGRLALPEAKIGIVPGWSGTQRLVRLLPEPVVKEMALFGRQITAERAFQLGFVAECSEDALASGLELARSLGTVSPRANELAKAMIHGAVDEDRGAAIETLGSAAAAASSDRSEGVEAFLNKRPAEFDGQ